MDIVIKREFDGDELRIYKGDRGNIIISSVVGGKEEAAINLFEEEVAVISSL